MRTFKYKDYEITVHTEPKYNPNSMDNLPYDKVIPIEVPFDDFNTCFSINMEKDGESTSVLIIAPHYISVESCVLPHEKGLFMLLDNFVCLFDVEAKEIVKKVDLEPYGTTERPYIYGEDYIIHGEMNIYRVSKNLEIKWQYSGRDIWERYHGPEPAFEMKKDRICLYDFMDNYYELDYDGNLIFEKENPYQANPYIGKEANNEQKRPDDSRKLREYRNGTRNPLRLLSRFFKGRNSRNL